MINANKIGARFKHICLNLLLEGAACVLDCLDSRCMNKLTGWRGVPSQAIGGRMPMRLPNASSCTAWAIRNPIVNEQGFIAGTDKDLAKNKFPESVLKWRSQANSAMMLTCQARIEK